MQGRARRTDEAVEQRVHALLVMVRGGAEDERLARLRELIDARTAAEAAKAEAAQAQKQAAQDVATAEARKAELLAEASKEAAAIVAAAETERQRIIDGARTAAEGIVAQARHTVDGLDKRAAALDAREAALGRRAHELEQTRAGFDEGRAAALAIASEMASLAGRALGQLDDAARLIGGGK